MSVVALMVTPTLLVGAVLQAPATIRRLRRAAAERSSAAAPAMPDHPPIEVLAADLRRLLLEYDAVKESADLTLRAHHLRALEGAIADCATSAAHALDIPSRDRPPRGALAIGELSRLLRSLADAGLVLPADAHLLTADRPL